MVIIDAPEQLDQCPVESGNADARQKKTRIRLARRTHEKEKPAEILYVR